MATSKTDKKTINHHLTMGAALVLKNALTQRGWYKDLPPAQMLAAVDVSQGPLAALTDPKPKEDENQADYDARVAPMLTKPYDLPLTENERVACRECVRYHLKQAALPLSVHIAALIRELEIE